MNQLLKTLPKQLLSSPESKEIPILLESIRQSLFDFYGTPFSIWEFKNETTTCRYSQSILREEYYAPEILKVLSTKNRAEIIFEEAPFAILALPLHLDYAHNFVATGEFLTPSFDTLSPEATDLHRIRDWLNPSTKIASDEQALKQWLSTAQQSEPETLEKTGSLFTQNIALKGQIKQLEKDVDKVSENLASTYEEISLMYNLSHNLKLSGSDRDLGLQAMDNILECLPSVGIGLQFLPVADQEEITYDARVERELLSCGDFPLDNDEVSELLKFLQLEDTSSPIVGNENITSQKEWPFPKIKQFIITPVSEGPNIFGWLLAINHTDNDEFGSVEASLLNSVASILGIHSGNHELYRQQAELLASVVRALVSAIDAKDPYTCGHSDRVARIAIRIAKELKVETNYGMLYMAGLLHDVGKIGISDEVLQKPDTLTEEEFDHIKLHPGLGHKILVDIKQLSDALPVVLHHHERWDGDGYPHGLAGEEIPFLARIAAVADSYDAMTSDRNYRQGMALEKVLTIFREGSGSQWDPQVVNAFFSCLDDIKSICEHERANLTLDVKQWS
ncbi:MAG: HD-GYP domain-containing protein [Pirellulaceae bacterium]|nr:HD-GYP domain-containing protein [Pirellulaceae bacterium]